MDPVDASSRAHADELAEQARAELASLAFRRRLAAEVAQWQAERAKAR